MIYVKTPPLLNQFHQLSKQIKNFPITGQGIVQYAEHLGYDDGVIDFLKLFSSRMIFNSRTDFIEHCWLLKRVLHEEEMSEPEVLMELED